MPRKTECAFVAFILSGTIVFGAEPAPAAKKTFMDLKTTYVSFEITQVGSRGFGAPKDSLTDGDYRINKSLKFEIPLGMPLPGSCPSGTPMEQAMEEGRCMGWSFTMDDNPEVMDQIMSGKLDMSKNPMFAAGQFSIDDVTHFRFRDSPADGYATQTTTYKGSGVAYVAKSGMLLCDFKSMKCDLANVMFGGGDGDQVTITATSDVPGSETQTSKQDPKQLLPQVPPEIGAKMTGFPLTLPGPTSLTFTGLGKFQDNREGPDVVVKMTVSSKPADKPGGAPSK